MNNPTMLYKAGVSTVIWGICCDTTIVDETEVEEKMLEGWVKSPYDIPIEDTIFPDGSTDDNLPACEAEEIIRRKRGRPAKVAE